MWIIFMRHPRPDAAYWPGRQWLAALDALAWPALFAAAVLQVRTATGAVGQLAIALAVLSAVVRLHRALRVNHRYRFTTWRWGKVLAVLLLVGGLLKLAAH